jgi:fructose-bisphosphate aldolase class I
MNEKQLNDIAVAIVSEHKGILAADESAPTIQKRFASIQVESTEETGDGTVSYCSPQRVLSNT